MKSRRWLYLIVGLILVQAFVGNGATSLWDEDEAAYAAFSRTMVRTGDWVVPHFIWSEPHRKTPLLFWCIASLFKLFGESEFLVRLPTTLAILGTIVVVGLLGRRLVGERAAWFAALILAANPFVPNLGKVAVTDALVLLCDTLLAFALVCWLDTARWRWAFLFWGALAVGMLAKGPPTLLLAGGLFLWALVVDGRRRTLWRLHPWFGLPLALLPVTVWGWLAWQRTDGALLKWMFDWYVGKRLAGGTVFGQVGPPGYHLALIFLGLLPWTILLPLAVARGRELWREPGLRLLLGWLVFGWFVWELAPSKLPAYAIGGYPAVALVLGRELDRFDGASARSGWMRLGMTLAAIAGVAVVGGLAFAGARFLGSPVLAAAVTTPWIVGLALGVRALLRLEIDRAALTFAIGSTCFLILVWVVLIPRIDVRRAVGPLVADAADALDPSHQLPVVFATNLHHPSIPFYVGRTRAFERPDDAKEGSCQAGLYVTWADRVGAEARVGETISIAGWNPDNNRQYMLSMWRKDCR